MGAVERLRAQLRAHLDAAEKLEPLLPSIERASQMVFNSLQAGGVLYSFGNGGSAADAQHLAAELVGRFRRERRPLPAVALTTDASTLTCIANDYAYEEVFSRQARALCGPSDVVVGISASGASENVVRGLAAAREKGAATIALTGGDGGRLAPIAHCSLVAPAHSTARIQEMHILIIHLICEALDDRLLESDGRE